MAINILKMLMLPGLVALESAGRVAFHLRCLNDSGFLFIWLESVLVYPTGLSLFYRPPLPHHWQECWLKRIESHSISGLIMYRFTHLISIFKPVGDRYTNLLTGNCRFWYYPDISGLNSHRFCDLYRVYINFISIKGETGMFDLLDSSTKAGVQPQHWFDSTSGLGIRSVPISWL